jgi:hypothetical protein
MVLCASPKLRASSNFMHVTRYTTPMYVVDFTRALETHPDLGFRLSKKAPLPTFTSTQKAGSAPGFCRYSRSVVASGNLALSQRLRLLVRCVVCTPLCRSAASVWQLLRNPAAKPAPDRRPLWLPLHSAAAAKPPGERATPRAFPFISDLFFLALLLIH